jgi:hypothetical protein
MKTYIRTALTGVAFVLMLQVFPAAVNAAGPGTRHSAQVHTPAPHAVRGHTSSDPRRKLHNSGGPLSYNAYWKAANSPNPPKSNQDYNRYWEKMDAWRRYHDQ